MKCGSHMRTSKGMSPADFQPANNRSVVPAGGISKGTSLADLVVSD